MVLKILIFIVLGVTVISCGSAKLSASTPDSTETYKKVVVNKLGEGVLYIANKSNSYVLCIKETKGSSLQPRNNINYLVIKLSDNTIALENKVDGGTVNWFSETEIEVYRTPGIMRDDQTRDDFITLYNVETGKSYPKNLKQTH